MTDTTHVGQGDPQNRMFKQIGTTADGQPIWAEYLALEPGSIGGGGSVASSVTIADGTTATQKAAVSGAGAVKVDGSAVTQPISGSITVTNFPVTQPVSLAAAVDVSDRVARLLGHVTVDNASIPVTGTFWQATQPVSGTFFQATQPVSLAAAVDVSDRVARLLGHVTVDNASIPVTGTFWQATQPVSIAAAVDVSDRVARLLGHVTVDNASIPVTGTFFQATQPVSIAGTLSDNLTQIAGVALAAKALPTNADGQVAIPVYVNSQQYATYDVAARNIATGALTANTAKAVLSLEHALASTKTVRIRRIMIHALQTTALAGLFDVQITRGTAASSAGAGVTPQARRLTDPAAEVVVKSLPTIVAANVADNIPAGGFGATTALYSPPVLVYDWQEAGETKPYLLVAGALQSLVINVISTVAHNLTLTISVDLTEE